MNTICKTDLMKLIRTPGNRFVSIYMPTYSTGRNGAKPDSVSRIAEISR